MKQRIRRYYNFKIGTRKTGEKPEAMKLVWPAILLFFVIGIISANIMNREYLNGCGIWSTYFVEKFKYAPIQSPELFYYVLGERLPMILLLFIFAITNWGSIAGTIFLSWQSFAAGFLMAAAVITYGIKGILLIGTAVFPQYLLYFPIYVAYIYLTAYFKKRKKAVEEVSKKTVRKEYMIFLILCCVLFGGYITGIFLESYINPYLLKKILKIF